MGKGAEQKPGKLEALYAPGYAYYGYAPEQPCQRPAQTKPEPCKYKP